MPLRSIGITEKRDGDTIETSVVTHRNRADLQVTRTQYVQAKADALAEAIAEIDLAWDGRIAEIDRLLAL